jgi:hypothetical protein
MEPVDPVAVAETSRLVGPLLATDVFFEEAPPWSSTRKELLDDLIAGDSISELPIALQDLIARAEQELAT